MRLSGVSTSFQILNAEKMYFIQFLCFSFVLSTNVGVSEDTWIFSGFFSSKDQLRVQGEEFP